MPGRAPLSAHLSFVALAAMALGVGDAVLIAGRKLGAAGAFQYVPPRLWLIAPLCWLAVALVVAPASYALRRGAALAATVMIALFLAVRFQEQSAARMGVAAMALIAAAILVRVVARWWTSAPRRAAVWLTASLIIALAIGAIVTGRVGEHRLRASHAPAASAPDVLVVFLDTVPYDSLFSRDGSVDPRLPTLSRLASRSVVFDRAYTTSPWTLPAHFSAVTGLPAHRLGLGFDDQHYDLSTPTLAERFRRRGYRTVAVISNTFLNRGTGFDRGVDVYEQAANGLDVCRTAPGRLVERWWPWFGATVCNWSASEVTARAIRHLDHGGPLFLLLNYMDAHDPYHVERGCARSASRGAYERHRDALRCIDRRLGELIARVERRNRGAIIAVLSDHGEQFGEHGLTLHGNSLYHRLLHVPLMITIPGAAPRRVQEPVSLAVLPRLLDDPAPPPHSVVSFLSSPRALAREQQWSIIRGPWHLIVSGKREELYDLASDPAEVRNLARMPAMAATRQALAAELARERRSLVEESTGTFRSLGYIR